MYPSCQKTTALPQDLNQQDPDAAQDALVHGFLVCWVLIGIGNKSVHCYNKNQTCYLKDSGKRSKSFRPIPTRKQSQKTSQHIVLLSQQKGKTIKTCKNHSHYRGTKTLP